MRLDCSTEFGFILEKQNMCSRLSTKVRTLAKYPVAPCSVLDDRDRVLNRLIVMVDTRPTSTTVRVMFYRVSIWKV